MSDILNAQAVASIIAYRERHQEKLDGIARASRGATVRAYRALAIQDVPADSPAYPVCAAVAAGLIVGRDDGYPAVQLPADVRKIILAAVAAGIIEHRGNTVTTGGLAWYSDLSGIHENPEPWQADYDAWDAAETYRKTQQPL